MSEEPQRYLRLDYDVPQRPLRVAWMERTVDAVNVLLASFAITLLAAAARVIVLLLSSTQPLFALPW